MINVEMMIAISVRGGMGSDTRCVVKHLQIPFVPTKEQRIEIGDIYPAVSSIRDVQYIKFDITSNQFFVLLDDEITYSIEDRDCIIEAFVDVGWSFIDPKF